MATRSRVTLATLALATIVLIVAMVITRGTEGVSRRAVTPDVGEPGSRPFELPVPENCAGRQPPDDSTAHGSVVAVLVRDLADGAPVPGVSFRVIPTSTTSPGTGDRGGSELTSDRDGRLQLQERVLSGAAIELVSDDWKMPAYRSGEVERTRSIWIYRRARVWGTIRGVGGEGPLNPTIVSLVALGVGLEGYGRPDHQTPEPWNPQWLIGHRVQRHDALPSPEPDGTFHVHVPRIRGVVLRATAPGWRMTWARVPIESGGDEFKVDLTLFASYSVSGVIQGEDGEPMSGLRVVAYVTQFGNYDQINYEQLQLGGHEGHTAWWSQKDNSSAVNYMEGAVTDHEGRFKIELKADGDVLIVAHAQGRIPIERGIGWMNSDSDIPPLVARRPSSPSRVRILYGGQPLAEHRMLIGDLSRGHVQPSVRAATDSEGYFDTAWLVPGRRYFLVVYGIHETGNVNDDGIFEWSGQATLDLKQLPQNLD